MTVRGIAMFELYLVRHGDSVHDILTTDGREQMRLAVERWKKHHHGATRIYHAPARHVRASAKIFSDLTGIPSVSHPALAIERIHERGEHRAFANMVATVHVRHIVLIGHDETRRVCEEIVWRCFRRHDHPPYVPPGGVLRFDSDRGCELI